MSCFVIPARSMAAAVTGMSISTSLALVTARTWSLCANEMMATSRMFELSPSVFARLTDLGIGLAVGTEVADALERRSDLVVVDPHGFDAHADVHVLDCDLLQQMHQREVSSVEHDQGAGVRQLHGLAVERHVDDTERRDRACVREVDMLGGRDPVGRARTAGRDVDLPALGATLSEDLLLREAREEAGGRRARGVLVPQLGRRPDTLDELDVLQRRRQGQCRHQPSPGTKHSMSLMWPSRSSRHRGTTCMPVAIEPMSAASTACNSAESAPSILMSAHANGRSTGSFGCGCRTHAHVVTTPPGPTSTISAVG